MPRALGLPPPLTLSHSTSHLHPHHLWTSATTPPPPQTSCSKEMDLLIVGKCHIPESRPRALPPHHTFLTTSPSPTPCLPTPQVTFLPTVSAPVWLRHTEPWPLPSRKLGPESEHSETPDLLRYPDGPPISRDMPLNPSSTHFIYLSHLTSFGYATPLSELPASFVPPVIIKVLSPRIQTSSRTSIASHSSAALPHTQTPLVPSLRDSIMVPTSDFDPTSA
ncbi:uncharacterized protein EI90DRAFT_3127014 [Cantharellus anzutake]|uniref:uncharacterized protein n=1 Tax=Cantharellus anzutake TaxID=1750568 RepID=UPI001907BFFA|nr:uncharacterized protein EI90DRAFT_3127014 [Cantharellus anzutake]KAF8327372.1 hypothetical protein EI90DRAFT_3127014 [Cantharellus anzutake]